MDFFFFYSLRCATSLYNLPKIYFHFKISFSKLSTDINVIIQDIM